MNVFDDIQVEDFQNCANSNYTAGILTRIYFAPAHYFKKIILPGAADPFLIKAENLEFNKYKGWSFIDSLVDEGELRNTVSGSVQRKKSTSSLDIFLLGFRADLVEMIEKIKNEPLVFLIIDSSGTQWLFGNLLNRAFIEKADGTTAKKYEENSGYSVSLSSKSNIYPLEGDSTKLYINSKWFWVLTNDSETKIYSDSNNKLITVT